MGKISKNRRSTSYAKGLAAEEMEVLRLFSDGFSEEQIAHKLNCSVADLERMLLNPVLTAAAFQISVSSLAPIGLRANWVVKKLLGIHSEDPAILRLQLDAYKFTVTQQVRVLERLPSRDLDSMSPVQLAQKLFALFSDWVGELKASQIMRMLGRDHLLHSPMAAEQALSLSDLASSDGQQVVYDLLNKRDGDSDQPLAEIQNDDDLPLI